MTTFTPSGPTIPEAKKLFPEEPRADDGGRTPALLRGDGERRLSDRSDEQDPPGPQPPRRARSSLVTRRARKASSTRRLARSISGASSSSAGSTRCGSGTPSSASTDYSFRPDVMRPVAEYLKLQGRFLHLHAEHIATLQRFANQQWQMMGIELPEALGTRGGCQRALEHGHGGAGRRHRPHGVISQRAASAAGLRSAQL